MTYRIQRQELTSRFRAARRAASRGREVCGSLVRQGNRLVLVPVTNASKNLGSFSITPNHLFIALAAHRLPQGQVVGSYHSHPWSSAEPGESDIAQTWNGSLMLILSCWHKDIRLWRIQEGKAEPVRYILFRE